MIFNPDHSALYVSVPKTGCTTIKTVMAAAAGMIDPQSAAFAVSRPSIHGAWTDREGKWSDVEKSERDSMLSGAATFRFTSVRNPFERVVSCYLNKIVDHGETYYLGKRLRRRGEVSLLGFLRYVESESPMRRDVHCRAMVDLTFIDQLHYDDIVKFETFETDLRRIMQRLGVGRAIIPSPTRDATTDAGSRMGKLLGPKECGLIREIYARDFEAFGYATTLA